MILSDLDEPLKSNEVKNISRLLLEKIMHRGDLDEWSDVEDLDALIHKGEEYILIKFYVETYSGFETHYLNGEVILSFDEFEYKKRTGSERLNLLITLDRIHDDLSQKLSIAYSSLPFITNSLDDLKIYEENLSGFLKDLSELSGKIENPDTEITSEIDISFINKYQYKDSISKVISIYSHFYELVSYPDSVKLRRTGRVDDQLESKLHSLMEKFLEREI